jgi:hypothetical protein
MNTNKAPSLKNLNVKYFKLLNGDCIISYVHDKLDEENAVLGLEEPMTVLLDEEGQYVLTPYLPFATQTVHLLDSYNIIMESDVDSLVKAHYIKMVMDVGGLPTNLDASDSKYLN